MGKRQAEDDGMDEESVHFIDKKIKKWTNFKISAQINSNLKDIDPNKL